MPSAIDYTSRDGAILLARRIQDYWLSLGIDAKLTVSADSAGRGWAVRSNLTGREPAPTVRIDNPYKKGL